MRKRVAFVPNPSESGDSVSLMVVNVIGVFEPNDKAAGRFGLSEVGWNRAASYLIMVSLLYLLVYGPEWCFK